jgi:Lysozyme like domain
MTATGTVYTYSELEGLWINAGGSAATAPIAAAIAEAESAGQAAVTSVNPDGGTNVGLWQLDTKGVGSGYTATQLSDPTLNAAVAVKGSANGTDWADWATYVSGAYKPFLDNATTPTTTGLPSPTTTAATLTSSTSTTAGCLISVPSVDLYITSVGGGCLITASQARALIGGLVIAAAGLIMIPGLLILAAAGAVDTIAAGPVNRAAGAVGLAKVTAAV